MVDIPRVFPKMCVKEGGILNKLNILELHVISLDSLQ